MARQGRSGVWTLLAVVALVATPALAAVPEEGPLEVKVRRHGAALEVSFRLLEPLPESFINAIPSGAQVQVAYPLKVRSVRRLWLNRKVWQGEVASNVSFDPVTGRYRCELVLEGVIVTSVESSSADEARAWLAAPPPVRLAIPFARRQPELLVRVRAVFSSSTRWLLFPSVEGTDWVEVGVEPR